MTELQATSENQSFDKLSLSPDLRAALKQLEYVTMTPIQAASLPILLNGHDLRVGRDYGNFGRNDIKVLNCNKKLNRPVGEFNSRQTSPLAR